jgi:multidrug efflux pump subunit AcrA (membrane-fusion protein)
MSTSSSDSAPVDGPRAASPTTFIHDRVVDLANQSVDRSEFLRLLAADLRTEFHAAMVAIQASHWSRPMLLLASDLSPGQIDHDAVADLLATATPMPIACDIPIRRPDDSAGSARGIRIELTSAPERTSVLLVYPSLLRPAPETQIIDLKRISVYADSTRGVVPQLPIRGDGELSAAESGMDHPLSSEIVRSRKALRLFHLDLDLNGTSYRIANESRRLLGCDRTTVLVRQRGRYRVKAVSGVSVFDSRSNSIRATERLAQSAMVASRPMILPSEEQLPPQIQEPLDHYLDESSVMTAVLIPLRAPDSSLAVDETEVVDVDSLSGQGDIIGVIVLEYFAGRAPATVDPKMNLVAGEASLALRNSLEHKQIFGLSLWKAIGGLVQSSRLPIVTTTVLVAVGLLLGSLIIQVEHYVVAKGSAEPTARREVYAPMGGIVKKLHVHDGQMVNAGDLLFELENSELENRAESLAGEIQTAAQRLNSILAMRLSSSADPQQSSRMALEERQLKSELANLRAQQKIVVLQQKELSITSPIDGTVIGWQLKRRLTDRPIARGDLLISVADHNGPWSLRLQVPDRDAGPILTFAQGNQKLPVRFAVATHPEASFAATLHCVSTAARMDQWGEHVIDATASVTVEAAESMSQNMDTFLPGEMRIGADVTAKIACGKRTILRSWFGDVFDFVHRNILFYF